MLCLYLKVIKQNLSYKLFISDHEKYQKLLYLKPLADFATWSLDTEKACLSTLVKSQLKDSSPNSFTLAHLPVICISLMELGSNFTNQDLHEISHKVLLDYS